jgi:hypothetical protein
VPNRNTDEPRGAEYTTTARSTLTIAGWEQQADIESLPGFRGTRTVRIYEGE